LKGHSGQLDGEALLAGTFMLAGHQGGTCSGPLLLMGQGEAVLEI
jgi:hypothetical protein